MITIKACVPESQPSIGPMHGVVVTGWSHPTTSVASLAFALRVLPSVHNIVREMCGIAPFSCWIEVDGQQFHNGRYGMGHKVALNDARIILERLAEKCASPKR